MNQRFRITVGSEPDYENLVGDIYFDDAIVCVLTQEHGFDSMQMKLFGPPGAENWEFELRDFEEAVATLKKRLWDLRRTE